MRNYIILGFIVFFAGLFRFYAIGYDLPISYNTDEPYLLEKAIEVADGKLRHGVVIRGSLPYYVTAGVIKTASLLYPKLYGTKNTLSESYRINPSPFYIIGRSISAFYSLLEIIILFFIGKALGNTRIGLLAAFFNSLSNYSITWSHQITPDTALSATILITFLVIIKAYQKNDNKLFILASLLTGFSAAQKLPGILISPSLFLAFFLTTLQKKMKLLPRIFMAFSLLLWIGIGYWLAYPFLFQNIYTLIKEWRWENATSNWYWGETILKDIGILGRTVKYINWLYEGTGTFLFYLGIFGISIYITKNRVIGILLNLFVLTFLIGISLPTPNFARWVLPLVPFVSLFSSVFLVNLWNTFFQNHKFGIMFPLLILISLAPFFRSVFVTLLYTAPDTRFDEMKWLRDNYINEKQVLRDIYTSVNVPVDKKRLSQIDFSKLQNFRYFISSSDYLAEVFTNNNINDQKIINRYLYVFSNFEMIRKFSHKITSIYPDDIHFLLSFSSWNFFQKKGPDIYIYDLFKSVSPQRFYLF